MKIKIDFRLFDVSMELYALEEHYKLIEKQILHLNHLEHKALAEYREKNGLTPDDPDWDIARQEFDHKVEFLFPRFFWGPFIVSLYAVFEASVMEIAILMQKTMNQGIAINDLRGDFLEKAKKYYKHVLDFELYNNDNDWQHIKFLTDIRHAIAHANGRMDRLNDKVRKKIIKLEKQNIGVSTYYDYVMVDSNFSWKAFSAVKSILENLVSCYKIWDTKQKTV
jgi:hypothetical protein